MASLGDADLSERLDKEEGEKTLAKLQQRLLEARLELGGLLGDGTLGPPLCVVFEGWDASGKGGAIKRLVAPLDPRHVTVAQFAAPTPREKRLHILWRFWPLLPGRGGMCVFDRSWYGRVLVERVEGFATKAEWKRAYDEIVAFEQGLCRDEMILVKLWLHISPKEQLRRFEERQASELKRWKLTDEDWRNREKRPAYTKAVGEMLKRTDHELAPWHVIPGDSKPLARVRVVETVLDAIARAR